MSAVSSTAQLNGLKHKLGLFLDWWKGELAEMLPAFLRESSPHLDNLLLVLTDERGARLLLRSRGHWKELGELRAANPVQERTDILRAAKADKRTTVLRLPVNAGLRRQVELPLAAEDELRQVLNYQMDTLSPYPVDQVYFDYRILSRDASTSKLAVELFLCPRESIEKWLKQANEWGLSPDFADFVIDDELTPPGINLLPSTEVPEKNRGSLSRLNLLLLFVTLLLLATLAAFHLMGKAEQVQELQTRVETARLKADAAIKLRQQVEKLQQDSSVLQNTKRNRLPSLMVLTELTRILPDGTWLERLILNEREINLYGLSSKASTLISEIEKSTLFENVEFEAPVVQDNRKGGERFQISAALTLPEEHDD